MYKKGDQVRIRSDLKPQDLSNNVGWCDDMYKTLGQIGTITNVEYKPFNYGSRRYGVKINIVSWSYLEDHLEPVSKLNIKYIYEV